MASVTSVGSLSSAGIGSGLDVESIVSKLMAIERRPLDQLESQETDLNTELSTYGKVQSYFSALQTASNALVSPTLWKTTTATSADTTAVKVSSDNAAAGNYAISVSSLATGQTVTSSTTFSSSSATLNAGTLTIELGTWTGTPASGFTAKSGSSAVVVSIADGATDLASIRDKINAADAGVVASIITDATGARLSLRSAETGEENGFRVTAAETVDDGVATTGLSALAYDATNASSTMTSTQSAANAVATINGITVTSASNTLSNVVDGLTVTLLKQTSSDVDVAVAADTATIKTKITDFVTAYNTLSSYLHTQMAYNADSKTGGALQGDQSALGLQRQLRAILNESSTASSTWSRLSDIGIVMKSDGTLETSDTKLENALGDLGELRKLLTADGTDSASSGFVRRWKNLADKVLGSGGTIENRTSNLNASLTRNGKLQDRMEERLAQIETRLRAQYTALDTKMGELSNLSSYLTQQIKALTSSSSS